jgi:hypothetical protein
MKFGDIMIKKNINSEGVENIKPINLIYTFLAKIMPVGSSISDLALLKSRMTSSR